MKTNKKSIILIVLVSLLVLCGCESKKNNSISDYEEKGLNFTYSLSVYTSNRDSNGECYDSSKLEKEECERVLLTDLENMILTFDIFDDQYVVHYQPSAIVPHMSFRKKEESKVDATEIITDLKTAAIYVEYGFSNGDCSLPIKGESTSRLDKCSDSKDYEDLYNKYLDFIKKYNFDFKQVRNLMTDYENEVVNKEISNIKNNFKKLNYNDVDKIIKNDSRYRVSLSGDSIFLLYNNLTSVKNRYQANFAVIFENNKPKSFYIFNGLEQDNDIVYIYDFEDDTNIVGYHGKSSCKYYPITGKSSSCTDDELDDLKTINDYGFKSSLDSFRLTEEEIRDYLIEYYKKH